MLLILSTIVVVVLLVVLYLCIISPGKSEPLVDMEGKIIPNSISVKTKMKIGGIEQGFFIRGEDINNPVILYLHGGPGSPELPLIIPSEKHERLEKYFTVCYWDQRGAGMSYSKSIDPLSMTAEQMVEDAYEITIYLMEKFAKEKIYLMGHSWGSYLGVKTIEKYPQLYHAYIGIGQVADQRESEILSYDYMLSYATEINDKADLKLLEKYGKNTPLFLGFDYFMKVRTPLMNKYGIGIMHKDYKMSDLTRDVLYFKGYTLSEKIGYMRGSLFSYQYLFNQYVLADNLFETSLSFDIPIYITHGVYDYQVSYALACKFYEVIDAPRKSFYSFEHSAHSPNMEEPEKFVGILRAIEKEIVSLDRKSEQHIK